MDPEDEDKTAIDTISMEEDVSFSRVTAVATGWMLDFLFVSLCRSFKEAKLDEFNERLSTFEGNAKLFTTDKSNLSQVN